MGIFTKNIKRAALGVLLLGAFSSQANAMGGQFFDYWGELEAYPTGAGQVYGGLSNSNEKTFTADNENYSDYTTPADHVDVKYWAATVNSYSFVGHAIPAQGWIFAGWAGAKRDADGNYVYNDSISYFDFSSNLKIKSTNSFNSEEEAQTNFPFISDTLYYAIFTHVATRVAVGQSELGSAVVDKVSNNIGDAITLTATVKNPKHTRFDYWVNKTTGEKFTANPLSLTVQDTAYYEAHFKCDSAFTYNFPEEGGWAVIYSDTAFSIPDNVTEYTLQYKPDQYYAGEKLAGDSLEYNKAKDEYFFTPEPSGYRANGKEPHLLYGTGEATFIHEEAVNDNPTTLNLLKLSGDKGIDLDTMSVDYRFYTIDAPARKLHLITSNTIAPNTFYLQLPTHCFTVLGATDAPETLTWYTNAEYEAYKNPQTGIKTISANNGKAQNVKKGIYTLDGKKLSRINGKGIYVINGKVVVVTKD